MNAKKILSEISMTGMALLMTAPTVAGASNIHQTKAHYEHPSEVKVMGKRNNDASYEFNHTNKGMLGMGNPMTKRNKKLKIIPHNRRYYKNNEMNMPMNNKVNIPKRLKLAKHPKFKRGTKVIVLANHMKGMKGAKGKVKNAYYTKLYEINYKPTLEHRKLVKNHKWVITKELRPVKKGEKFVKGATVISKANHMPGMYNAKAKIVAIHNGPAYMINYIPTNAKDTVVVNHKWVAQDELKLQKKNNKNHHRARKITHKHQIIRKRHRMNMRKDHKSMKGLM